MFTLAKFAGKVAYDAVCISIGSALLWRNELKDLYLRGWLDPRSGFEAIPFMEMDHD